LAPPFDSIDFGVVFWGASLRAIRWGVEQKCGRFSRLEFGGQR
jgi:hypothetical protein